MRSVARTSLVSLAASFVLSGMMGPAMAADALQRTKDTGILKVCAVDGLLPYSSSDAKVPGFEVEIGRAIAANLNAKPDYAWVTWDALIPALTSERCDAIIDGLFITPERMKVIEFSKPYYASGETILVRKDNNQVKGLKDLSGRKTGVLAGSVTVQYLEKQNIKPLVVYPDQNTIIIELNNGRIDATLMEAPSAAWALQKDPSLNIKLVEGYVPDERYNAGVGVRKGDDALKGAIDRAIDQMLSANQVAAILANYQVPFYPPK